MTFTAKGRVIEVHDGSQYTDKTRRVVIQLEKDRVYTPGLHEVRIVAQDLQLGDEVELVLETTRETQQV